MLEKFRKIQEITIFTIIQNYKRIELKKMASLLKISESEVINQINNIERVGQGSSNWEKTIMNPLLSQKKKVNVQVVDKNVIFESQNQDKA